MEMLMANEAQETIYFAGGDYFRGDARYFGAVRPSNGLPYLTNNPNGLSATAHHASLYRLSEDRLHATMVSYRNNGRYGNPREVDLPLSLRDELQKAIASGKRYNQ